MRLLAIVGLLSLVATGKAEGVKESPKVLRPGDGAIGRFISDRPFTDSNGKAGTLSDYRSSRYLVVAMHDPSCPLCKKFTSTLAKIEADYTPKGVAFLFVNPTSTGTVATFKGRFASDAKGTFAATLGASTTTEVIVLDAARTVVYRGAIDDQYGLGYSLDAPKQTYLKNALDHLLVGKDPEVKATTSPGCALDLPKPDAVAVTYHNRISRIVQQNCQECHRAGGVGPFVLMTHEDLLAHKGMIRKVVDGGTMPPWFAAPPKEGTHSPFRNDKSLSVADKADLLAWLKSGTTLGDVADATLVKAWPKDWQIGVPDAVFPLPKPVEIKATGIMPYQNVIIETHLDEDKWVQAIEVQPGSRTTVHHVLVHVLSPGGGILKALPSGRPGIRDTTDDDRQGFFAAYVPGNGAIVLPEGYAKKLPKGAILKLQLHYTPDGTATTDRTRIGVIYAKSAPRFEAKVGAVANPRISIPPGADNHKETGKLVLPTEVTITSLMPHMHVRGKACRYELTTADGKTTTLLDVPHYDFNWQLPYTFTQPVVVPEKSTLTFTVWYDNSTNNPANPDATKTVKWGPQTFDEMHLGYVEYIVDREKPRPAKPESTIVAIPKGGVEIPEAFKDNFKKYDKNSDGKLDEAEIEALPPRVKTIVMEYIRKLK